MELQKDKLQNKKKSVSKSEKLQWYGKIGHWFQTLCLIHIPIFGFYYMLVKALRKKTPPQEKSFAIAYVLYRTLIMILAFAVLFVLYKVGLDFIDNVLQYAGS